MAHLITPTARLHLAWLEARDDWGPGVYQDGAGFDLVRPGELLDRAPDFTAWVSRLVRAADPSAGGVVCTYRWIVEGNRVLGAIALRHEVGAELLGRGGHIGYGVRPSERGRGLASWALGETLGEARALGLKRVLVVAEVDNVASQRVILSQGGVLEDEEEGVRRYWISL